MPPRRGFQAKPVTLESKIIKLVTSGAVTLDSAALADIKEACRIGGDRTVDTVFATLWSQMNRKHAQIRLAVLNIIEDFFPRSRRFRELLVPKIPELLTLGACMDGVSLPLPVKYGAQVQALTLRLITRWRETYPGKYGPLEIAFNHIKRLGEYAGLQAETSAIERRAAQERGERLREYQRIASHVGENFYEVERNALEMENCFSILIPSVSEKPGVHITNAPDEEGGGRLSMQQFSREIGLGSERYALEVVVKQGGEEPETLENHVLFQQLRENRRLAIRHQKLLEGWITALGGTESLNPSHRNEMLAKVLRARDRVLEDLAKANELLHGRIEGFDAPEEKEAEEKDSADEFFEVGEDYEGPIRPEDLLNLTDHDATDVVEEEEEQGDPPQEPATTDGPSESEVDVVGESEDTTPMTEEERKRQELLKTAPVVEWGEDLRFWGSEDVPDTSRGTEVIHRFFGKFEEREMSEDALQMMRLRMKPYKRKEESKAILRGKKDERRAAAPAPSSSEGAEEGSSGPGPSGAQSIKNNSHVDLGMPELDRGLGRGRRGTKRPARSALEPLRKPKTTAVERLVGRLEDPRRQRKVRAASQQEEVNKRRDRSIDKPI